MIVTIATIVIYVQYLPSNVGLFKVSQMSENDSQLHMKKLDDENIFSS